MENIHTIKWQALEYEHKEQNIDWFWGLGVVIFAGSVASILYGNYFFAIIILLGGGLLGYFSHQKPKMVEFELNNKGLKIENRIYLYENMKAFFVQKEGKTALFVKSNRPLLPVLYIPIDSGHTESIRNVLLAKKIPEEKMDETWVEKMLEYFGFQ